MLEPLDTFTNSLADSWRRLRLGGQSVILAVSGGADSLALMAASARLGHRLGVGFEVATVDHQLRRDSRTQADRVVALAQKLGLAAHLCTLDLALGPGLEARAREARYLALEQVRQGRGFSLVATAHTASDQAETVLMRLVRGSALGGAAAILERRGHLVRPMLWAQRDEVRRWLRSQNLCWHDDPMNGDQAFFRVKVRSKVLPSLEAAGGRGTTVRLARFARFAAEDDGCLTQRATEALRRLTLPQGGVDAIGLKHLPTPMARRVVARYLSERGLEVDSLMVEACLETVRRGGSCTLKRDQLLLVRRGVMTTKNFTQAAGHK